LRKSDGFALILVVLISSLALVTFLFASSTLALSSRSAAAGERNSTQAFLAADSGLNTLLARATTTPYEGGTFTAWIEGELGLLDLGDGITAELTVLNETPNIVTVQSLGKAGRAQRKLVRDYTIRKGEPLPVAANVPGALTSVGTITSNSNALCVNGKENSHSDWEISEVIVSIGNGNMDCNDLENEKKVTYRDAVLCDAREGYIVKLSDELYSVTNVPDDWPDDCSKDVTLQPLQGGIPQILPGTTKATIRPSATVAALNGPFGDESSVDVSSGGRALFGVGTPVTVGDDKGNGGNGTVVAVNDNTLTISWDKRPSATQPAGTIVRRGVSSAITGGTCAMSKSGTFPHGCSHASLSELFLSTFGVTQEAVKNDASTTRLTGGEYRNRILSGITWVENPPNNFNDQRGSGILIIEANAGQTIKLNTNNHFDGLIYVIGNASIHGNSQFHGAVVVEGSAELELDVGGTGGIFYDPLLLANAIHDIKMPNPEAGSLGPPVAGSWRIR